MTIKALFPTVLPTLNLDFANTKVLDPRITFTRASTGTFVGGNGLIQTAASGAARFDHNPTTGESLGLLVEEARTNLLLRSEEFDNAAWTKIRSTISTNATIAPNGTTTADKFIEDTTASSTHVVVQGASVASGTIYTATFYLKAGERNSIYLSLSVSFAGGTDALFNASTGVATNLGVTSCSMTLVNNGWYRCVATATANTTGTGNVNFYSYNGSSIIYTGDGTSGIYLWGAQLEQGAFATSYIPTTSATATRAADVASITGTNFSSWYNQTEGTWFVHHDARQVLLVANNNSFNERQPQMGLAAGLVHDFYSITGGAIQANNTGSTHVMGTPDRAAYALKTNDFIGACNGSLTGADTSGSFGSSITQLNIGAYHNGTSVAGGTFRRIAYWPTRLANITLQAITAS